MRLFQLDTPTINDAFEKMQYKGCANDTCYLHPYSVGYPVYFQFPHDVDLTLSNVGIYDLDGVNISIANLGLILSTNDYNVGTYKCGGLEIPVTNITGIPLAGVGKCFFLIFEIYDGIGNIFYYATEPFKPVELTCNDPYFNLTAEGLSSCGCDDYFYGKVQNVSLGNPDLEYINTLTVWGEYKRLADGRKYELNQSTNKKKSTTTFERWKIGSLVSIPQWFMEQAQILFDAENIVLTSPTLEAKYFDHSENEPFKEIDIPCSCHYIFDTVLENESCNGGIFCSDDGMVGGCTSPCFENYDPLATYDDGSCYTEPCRAEVTLELESSASYWQSVIDNNSIPDGIYAFLLFFEYSQLCNCATTSKDTASPNNDWIAPVIEFNVDGGVFTGFNINPPIQAWRQNINDPCKLILKPVTKTNYWALLCDYSSPPTLGTVYWNSLYDPNISLSPIISATKICI